MPLPHSENTELANSFNEMGILLDEIGEHHEAEAMHRKALEIRKAVDDLLGVASSLNNLAIALVHQDKLSEAETAFRASLDLRKNQLGEEHLEIDISLRNLAAVLTRLEKHDEAESTRRQIGNPGDPPAWDQL